jgi:hypothetical protein
MWQPVKAGRARASRRSTSSSHGHWQALRPSCRRCSADSERTPSQAGTNRSHHTPIMMTVRLTLQWATHQTPSIKRASGRHEWETDDAVVSIWKATRGGAVVLAPGLHPALPLRAMYATCRCAGRHVERLGGDCVRAKVWRGCCSPTRLATSPN